MDSPLKASLGYFPQGAEVSFYRAVVCEVVVWRAVVCEAIVCLLGEFMALGLDNGFRHPVFVLEIKPRTPCILYSCQPFVYRLGMVQLFFRFLFLSLVNGKTWHLMARNKKCIYFKSPKHRLSDL